MPCLRQRGRRDKALLATAVNNVALLAHRVESVDACAFVLQRLHDLAALRHIMASHAGFVRIRCHSV